ncbi:hypothetical protein LUU34_00387300 [Aix galericulata]|nr:hypothetical protein LUU34_00387300 [Aix galericulata]
MRCGWHTPHAAWRTSGCPTPGGTQSWVKRLLKGTPPGQAARRLLGQPLSGGSAPGSATPGQGERRAPNPGRGPVAPAAPPPEAALGGERSPGDGGAATRQRQAPAPAPSPALPLPLLPLLRVVVVPLLLLCALRGAAAPAPPPCSRTRSRAGSSRCSTASAASRCRSGTRRCGARRGRRARGEPRVPPPQPWVPPPRVASPPGRSRGACPAPPHSPRCLPAPRRVFRPNPGFCWLSKKQKPPRVAARRDGDGHSPPSLLPGAGSTGLLPSACIGASAWAPLVWKGVGSLHAEGRRVPPARVKPQQHGLAPL